MSVKKVKWLIPDAWAAIFDLGRRNRAATRETPPANSWHMLTLSMVVAVLTASATRLSGLVRLMRNVSGQ